MAGRGLPTREASRSAAARQHLQREYLPLHLCRLGHRSWSQNGTYPLGMQGAGQRRYHTNMSRAPRVSAQIVLLANVVQSCREWDNHSGAFKVSFTVTDFPTATVWCATMYAEQSRKPCCNSMLKKIAHTTILRQERAGHQHCSPVNRCVYLRSMLPHGLRRSSARRQRPVRCRCRSHTSFQPFTRRRCSLVTRVDTTDARSAFTRLPYDVSRDFAIKMGACRTASSHRCCWKQREHKPLYSLCWNSTWVVQRLQMSRRT